MHSAAGDWVGERGDESIAGVCDFDAAVRASAISDKFVVAHDVVAAELIAKLVQHGSRSNEITHE